MRNGILLLLCVALQAFADEVKLADATAAASVERTRSPAGFAVSVVFRPVTTLDDVSNREMSAVMAQFYADEALSSFLNAQKAIIPSRVKSSTEKTDQGNVKWQFAVPEDAVIDAPVKEVDVREEVVGKKGRLKTGAKTRLQDFRSTCFRDLRVAETLFAEEIETAKKADEKEMLKRRIQDALAALRRKIKEDDDLFRAEKSELTKKVDKIESFLLSKLEGSESEAHCKEKANELPIKDAVFKEPFGSLLKADPILLTHGGARFVQMKDGRVVILSVGSAAASNDDREDIVELKASAELGKLQAGEETAVANKLERKYVRSANGSDMHENMNMKRTSSISFNSIDFHKSGETVGTWLSKDGKRFFLAKGRIALSGQAKAMP